MIFLLLTFSPAVRFPYKTQVFAIVLFLVASSAKLYFTANTGFSRQETKIEVLRQSVSVNKKIQDFSYAQLESSDLEVGKLRF